MAKAKSISSIQRDARALRKRVTEVREVGIRLNLDYDIIHVVVDLTNAVKRLEDRLDKLEVSVADDG